MPNLSYGLQAYRRLAGGLPELKLVNMVVERTPAAREGVVLMSRPGMVPNLDLGDGPIAGVFHVPRTSDDWLLTVVGGSLFNHANSIGDVGGSGPAAFAASSTQAIVTRGTGVIATMGSSVSTVTMPDAFNATGVAYLAGLFIASREGSQRFYWWVPGENGPDALDYAAAETTPDELVDLVRVRDMLAMPGTDSIEFWAPTGDADLPFVRIEERLYTVGVRGRGCSVELDNTLIFVGSDNIVYRGEEIPKRLSDHAMEERLAASETCRAFAYTHDGHSYFVVRIDGGTWQVDLATGGWSELLTGQGNFVGGSATRYGNKTLIGDVATGVLYELDSESYRDGNAAMERRFTAVAPIGAGTMSVSVVRLDADFGRTPLLTGQGADPEIEMRTSDDGGATWGPWDADTLGRQGDYRSRPEWRALGMFDVPGFLSEFRVTDPVPLRISSLTYNEAGGGRA